MNAWSIVGLIALVGSALLAAGLVLWPYPKHRRCAKCAYDMAALPGLTCPECGRAHPNDPSLLRRGRPWRRAARMIGIGILLSYACYAIPRILTRGLPGVIPSTALMLAAPWLDPGQRFPSPTGHPGLAMPRRLGDELLARLKDPQRWRWQSVLFTRACAALSTPPDRSFALRPAAWPECWLDHAFESCDSLWALDPFLRSTIETHLRIRRRWPAGRPLFATHDFQSLGSRSHGTIAVRVREGGTQLGGSEGSRDTYLGQLSPGLHALEIEVAVLRYVSADAAERVTAWSATRKATVEIVPSVDDMLRRCSTDQVAAVISRAVTLNASVDSGMVITVTVDDAAWIGDSTAAPPLRMRLRAAGTAESRPWTLPISGQRLDSRQAWSFDGARWSIAFRVGITLEEFLASPVELDVFADDDDALAWEPASSCWSGELHFLAAPVLGDLILSRVPVRAKDSR